MSINFIAIEGADYSGKTTFAEQLERVLTKLGRKVASLRSPGGDESGEKIRELLVNTPLSEQTRTIIFSGNRVHNSDNVIKPAIERGETVIGTRWRWSSNVYQDNIEVADYLDEKFNVAQPDLYILLKPNPLALEKLRSSRGDEQADLMDIEYTQNYELIRDRFQQQYEQYTGGLKYQTQYVVGNTPPTDEEFEKLYCDLISIIIDSYDINSKGNVNEKRIKSGDLSAGDRHCTGL